MKTLLGGLWALSALTGRGIGTLAHVILSSVWQNAAIVVEQARREWRDLRTGQRDRAL